jgi:sortase A
MSDKISRRIANLFIWLGLALIAFGVAMAYPFVRDAIQAESAPSTLSFVVTPDPAQVEATLPASTSAHTPTPIVTASAAAPAPSPTTTTTAAPPVVTSVPTPAILPDDSTSSMPKATAQAVAQPTSVITGDPPDRIAIPAIQLDAPVVAAGWHVERAGGASLSVWDVPDWRAAGWLRTSAPAGQKGNTVLDGHHNVAGEVFRRLVDLKPKDVIELYAGSKVFQYSVTAKYILPDRDQPMEVRIANAKWIQPTDDERLTLVTCWPYTNNTHRLIIVARPFNQNGGKGIE